MSRFTSRPLTETDFQELIRVHRAAERRSPPDDTEGQEPSRRTRQRRSGPPLGEQTALPSTQSSRTASSMYTPSTGFEERAMPRGHRNSGPMYPNVQPWLNSRFPPSQRPTSGQAAVDTGRLATSMTQRANLVRLHSRLATAQGPVIAYSSSGRGPLIPNPLLGAREVQPSVTAPTHATLPTRSTSLSDGNIASQRSAESDLTSLRPGRSGPW